MTPTPRLVPDRPVTEEVIAAALNAQPLTGSNKALRVWQLFDNAEEASIAMKGALDAALAAMAAAPPAEASADLTIAHPSRGVVDEVALAEVIQNHTGCGDSDSIYAAHASIQHLQAAALPADHVAVDRGALQLVLNVLRRAGKDEVADALTGAALPAVPEDAGRCSACKGSGEVEALTPHTSGDPQDAYMAPATCEVCDGNGGADPWMPVASVLPMTPGWYICLNYGRVEPLRFDGAYWHHTRMTRDLAGPSHWRTFESVAAPAQEVPDLRAGVDR